MKLCMRAENSTIARNRANFTIKLNIWDQKVNHAIVKPHCLNPHYLRTYCMIYFFFENFLGSNYKVNPEILLGNMKASLVSAAAISKFCSSSNVTFTLCKFYIIRFSQFTFYIDLSYTNSILPKGN